MASPLDQKIERLNPLVRALAITLWLILAVVIAGKTLQNPKNHSTYPLFYEASVAWWNGVDVYDRNVFADDYRYGPSFAMVLGAIACLPLGIGATVWALMNVGIALWATMSLARRVLPGMQSPLSRNLLLAVSVFPSAHCLYSGQTNLLVFSLVAFAAIAILDERWWLAAVLLAIPIHIKVWPLAGALLLTACWPRRLAWRLPIALAAVAALPLLAKPPAWVCEQYVEWYRLLVGSAQIRHTYRDAWTIWELISSRADPLPPWWYTGLELTTAAAAFGLCLWQAGRLPPARRVLLALACWTAWQLVFGPGTERNTFALIAPMTSWAVVIAVLEKRAPWLMGLGFLLTVFAALGVGGGEDVFPWLKALHPIGILLFFTWFFAWNWQENKTTLQPAASTLPAGA